MIYLNLVILFIHSYSTVIASADSLYSNKMYDNSYIEYRRAFFYYPDSIESRDFAKFIINIYDMGDIKSGDVYMEEWDYLDDDSVSYYRDLTQIYSKLLKKDVSYEGDVLKKEFLLYSYFLKGDRDNIVSILDSIEDKRLCEIADSLLSVMRDNPNIAFYMSLALPGSGLYYLGYKKRGLSMMAVNTFINFVKLYMSYTYFPYFKLAYENRMINNGVIRYGINMAMGDTFIFSRFTQGSGNITAQEILNYYDKLSVPIREYLKNIIKKMIFQ